MGRHQAIADAYRAASDAVRDERDEQAAYDLSVELLDLLAELRREASRLRTQQVRRIWGGTMALAELARRTGLSKSRVAQMVPPPPTRQAGP